MAEGQISKDEEKAILSKHYSKLGKKRWHGVTKEEHMKISSKGGRASKRALLAKQKEKAAKKATKARTSKSKPKQQQEEAAA